MAGIALAACLLLGIVCLPLGESEPEADFATKAFSRLERIREAKKREVIACLDDVQRLAKDITDDTVMRRFFMLMSKEDYEQDDELEYFFDRHAVSKYGDFYDILLVNMEGYVFHSVRQESDYHTNLFTENQAETKLVREMRKGPDLHFVEYEYYSPSDEPAAFFASPLFEDAKQLGWFVLQYPINRVNTILSDPKGLGRTGEVYLVNKEKWMLTDSRFVEDCTTLRQKVDTWAVRAALEEGIGTRTIQDYRDVPVLSAFECFDILGTSWMILCEIDEDEVLTEHYKKYAEYYNREIFAYSARKTTANHMSKLSERTKKRVDLNEFAKAEPGERLETYGVATCTAAVVAYPERFAYLAHIGPNDAIYAKGKGTWFSAGNGNSDFLGELIRRIRHYDIYPYESDKLQFTIIAPHGESYGNALRTIVNNGIGLGSIKLLCNPKASYANVVVDPADDLVAVVWTDAQPNKRPILVDAAKVEDLGAIVKKLSGYEG
jgi:hypothetical protein